MLQLNCSPAENTSDLSQLGNSKTNAALNIFFLFCGDLYDGFLWYLLSVCPVAPTLFVEKSIFQWIAFV